MNYRTHKILFSIPVILIIAYLIPVLGVILIIARQIIFKKKWYNTSAYLIGTAICIYLFKIINEISKLLGIEIVTLNSIINSEIYISLMDYANTLLIIGIIFLVVSSLLTKLGEKLGNMFRSVLQKHEKQQYQIQKENNMKIQEMKLKSQNTGVVICKNCGAENILTDTTGICAYCRTALENKNRKK